MSAAIPGDILRELEALRAAFAKDAGGMVADIAASWNRADAAPTPASLSDLMSKAHRLAGTAATFALPALSTPAAALEECVAAWLSRPELPAHARAATLVAALERAAAAA